MADDDGMDFAKMQEAMKETLNELFKNVGVPEYLFQTVDPHAECGYDVRGQYGGYLTELRSNLLRDFFLSEMFPNALAETIARYVGRTVTALMDRNGQVTADEFRVLGHLAEHMAQETVTRVLRDGVEPLVKALHDQGLYQPHSDRTRDFACMRDRA